MGSGPYPVMKVGKFQFENLMRTPVSYLLLDLRPADAYPRFPRQMKTTEEEALRVVQSNLRNKSDPIIVICQDGALSDRVAQKILEAGYINVVWLEGGCEVL